MVDISRGIRAGAVLGLAALGLVGPAAPAAAQVPTCAPVYAIGPTPLWYDPHPGTALSIVVDTGAIGGVCAQTPPDGPLPRGESGVGWSNGRQFVVTRTGLTAFRDQTCPGRSSGYRSETGRCLMASEYNDASEVIGPPGEYLNDPTRNPITGR